MNYFKGWYFKCTSETDTIAFIPAYHRCHNKTKVSLQIITNEQTYSLPYHFQQFNYQHKKFVITLGRNIFSYKGITLRIHRKDLHIHGNLRFGLPVKPSYDIMGPFAFIPMMQCQHAVYSLLHTVTGTLTINNKTYHFQDALGYIEGDEGHSFPSEYFWTQCHILPHDKNTETGTFFLSAATIPFLGFHFRGVIGSLLIQGNEHRFATYLGARIRVLHRNLIVITQGKFMISQ